MFVIGALGLVLGPIIFAALAAVTSFGFAYVGAALCALAGILSLLVQPRAVRTALR
jgi:hypothetical protein